MEESHLETLSDENVELKRTIAKMEENLQWCTVVMAVLLQNDGGVLELDDDILAQIDLSKVNIRVRRDEEKQRYVVEGTFE